MIGLSDWDTAAQTIIREKESMNLRVRDMGDIPRR